MSSMVIDAVIAIRYSLDQNKVLSETLSCVCSMFCFSLLCVLSSFEIILMGKRELIALLCISYVL